MTEEHRHREVNGLFFRRRDFSDRFRADLLRLIQLLRPLFLSMVMDAITDLHWKRGTGWMTDGSRFVNDDEVLRRAEGGISEFHDGNPNYPTTLSTKQVEEIERQHLATWAWRALHDAATSDYYYMYEKDYGQFGHGNGDDENE